MTTQRGPVLHPRRGGYGTHQEGNLEDSLHPSEITSKLGFYVQETGSLLWGAHLSCANLAETAAACAYLRCAGTAGVLTSGSLRRAWAAARDALSLGLGLVVQSVLGQRMDNLCFRFLTFEMTITD